MGKTFNASVDWLGMVENPDQDVNPSVNGEKAQTGTEFTLEPRIDEEVMDPKLLSPAEYQKRISDHHNKFNYAYSSGQRKYPDADESWGEGWDDRYPEWSWARKPDGQVYKTPQHSSVELNQDLRNLNCIHGVCYYALDAGVESLGKYGEGQYQSNALFADEFGDNEGFLINHNPFDGRTYGTDFIYEGDIIQKLSTNNEGSDRGISYGRPHHAYMVVDTGNPTHSADRRVITLGHNSGQDLWKTEKYTLEDVLNMFSEKGWQLNANKNLSEKDRLALKGEHKYAKDYLTRDLSEIDFRFPGYGMGGNDNELKADRRFNQKSVNQFGIDQYSDGTSIDYIGSEWILETYKDYYTTLGKVADMPTDVLDKLMLNQIGIRVQESSKNPTKYKVSNIAKSFPGKAAKRAHDWLFGDDGTWEEDYWAKNVKNIQDKYPNIDAWKKDMYKGNNKSKRIFAIEAADAPLSRGPFQQKALSTRGREILKFLTGKEDVNFKDDVLGGPSSTKSARDNQQSREVLASLALAMDNWHMLKRHHEKVGTKINGKPLTNDMLIALATLSHNAPNKSMTKEYVEYYFDNYWKGKKNEEDGIAYLDNIDLYKGYLINKNNNKTFDPLRARNKTAMDNELQNRNIENDINHFRINRMQDGGPITEREKYIKFALDTESGHDYIRAKNSAVKKLGPDGKWDGKSYYKIYEDGKYYPYYVNDEKRATIGHGHHPSDRDIFEEYKGGITEDKALELLGEDIDEKLRLSEIYYNQRFGENTWDDLSEAEQFMLNDYTFNVRGGFHKAYKKFAKAIHDKDFKSAEKEYKRNVPRRNEIFLTTYLKPWMDIQEEKTTVAPDHLPLPIGTFPTDIDGNPIQEDMNMDDKKETSWWRGEEGWIPDELQWWKYGGTTAAQSMADGSRYEEFEQRNSIMPPKTSLNNMLTVNDNLALDKTIADLSGYKYGGSLPKAQTGTKFDNIMWPGHTKPQPMPVNLSYDDVELGASFLPYLGEAIDLKNTGKALYKGNYGEAALHGLGFLIPFVPGKAIVKGYKKFFGKSDDVVKKVDDQMINPTAFDEGGNELVPTMTFDGTVQMRPKNEVVRINRVEDPATLNVHTRGNYEDGNWYSTENSGFYNYFLKDASGNRLPITHDRKVFTGYMSKDAADKFHVSKSTDRAINMSGGKGTGKRVHPNELVLPPGLQERIRSGDISKNELGEWLKMNIGSGEDVSDILDEFYKKYGGQHMWGLDLRSTAQAGKEVKSDDIYDNDRYSQSAAKYKKMLPKYQSRGDFTLRADNTYVHQPQFNIPVAQEEQYVDRFGNTGGTIYNPYTGNNPNLQWISGASNQMYASPEQKQVSQDYAQHFIGAVTPIPILEGINLTSKGARIPGLIDDAIINPMFKGYKWMKSSLSSGSKTSKATKALEPDLEAMADRLDEMNDALTKSLKNAGSKAEKDAAGEAWAEINLDEIIAMRKLTDEMPKSKISSEIKKKLKDIDLDKITGGTIQKTDLEVYINPKTQEIEQFHSLGEGKVTAKDLEANLPWEIDYAGGQMGDDFSVLLKKIKSQQTPYKRDASGFIDLGTIFGAAHTRK